MAKPFNGVIDLDVRDSVADWDAFTADEAPDGCSDVLVVLYDDTGCAAWSPYGGRIEMPTLQRLADGGLTYSQWHTTASCSPTRSTFLTGRNHHSERLRLDLGDLDGAFRATAPTSRRRTGRSRTCCATPATARSGSARTTTSRSTPGRRARRRRSGRSGMGYDRFYGFIGGETNNTKERMGEHHESYGPLKLYIDDEVVAEQEIRTMTGHSRCAVRAFASATTAATPSASTRPGSRSPAARSSRSCSTSPATRTSTSSAISRRHVARD